LRYLYDARERGVSVIGLRDPADPGEAVVLRPESGPADAADPLWAAPRFDASVLRGLADEGYIDLQRTADRGASRVLILAKGLRAVGDPVEGAESDPRDALTTEQRLLLQTVFTHFHEEGDWPRWWDVGRELLDLDVVEVAKQLGPNRINDRSAGDAEYDRGEDGDRAILTLPAVVLCDGSEGELADFLRVLRLCLDRYFSGERNPKVSSGDLKQVLGMSDLDTRKAFLLTATDPYIFGGGSSSADNADWWRDISPRIRKYRRVDSIDEYLAKRPPLVQTSTPGAAIGSVMPTLQPQQPIVTPQRPSVEIADQELREACADLLAARERHDRAVDQACRVLEHRVRELVRDRLAAEGRDPDKMKARDLMARAFRETDPLLVLSTDPDEQKAAMFLYMGVMGFFRNKTAHQIVRSYDRAHAERLVASVDLLLDLADEAARAATNEGHVDGG
jgi:uncharacterized protein (TIGR02391 family)